jgi:CheY-like chemotaxis protein
MESPRRNKSKYKVLVADDDSYVRFTIEALLSSMEHFCSVASDGTEALDKTRGEHFDAVITDLQMPHMDGITLTRELLKQNPLLPVMVMTGLADSRAAGNAIASGASMFISKPFTAEQFFASFTALMLNAEAGASPSRNNPKLNTI